jgi:uncharacterized damage-inducible protein DinB
MELSYLQFLFDYNYWARDRILENAAKLTPQQLAEPKPYSRGSVRHTLVHILSAEWIWRTRCQDHASPTSFLAVDDFPSLEPLRLRWQQEEGRMREYLRTLTPAALEQKLPYQRTDGTPQADVVWHLLLHVVNHGTEHRSILAAELTAYGYSPGDLDIIQFVRVGTQ